MKFSELASYFEKLEATTKRLEMFNILAELFKKADSNEIEKIIYLCQEQILPPFRGVEMGVSEKLLIRAISQSAGVTLQRVEEEFKNAGDLGIVAEKFSRSKGSELEVSEVYDRLLKVALTTGEGSVEKKITILANLFSNASPIESKYIARFVAGRLRLGIGDPTILDALAQAKAGTRKFRPELERAYNLCSDLGLVAKTLFEKGEKGIREFKIKVFSPIRMALCERLPSSEDIVQKIGKAAIEPKYDGFRCQIHKDGDKVEIFSRNLERTTAMFPEIVEAAKRQIKAKQAIIEGEALAYNEETGELFPFQVTITRKRKHGVEELAKEYPLKLFAFELLFVDGVDYTQKPYIERREKMEQIITSDGPIDVAKVIYTGDPTEIKNYFEEFVEKGLEGVVAKRLDAPYSAGARNFNWIKLKRSYKGELADTIDVCIVGYFKGKGFRAKLGIGAILCSVYDEESDTFKTIAKVGSGFSEENWVKLKGMLDEIAIPHRHARVDSLIIPDVWVEPKYVITVMADEITRSPLHTCGRTEKEIGYALRFPRAVGFIRQDKSAGDANTVKEIIEMYEQQRARG
ncbi:MAG: ATP-dependent DNA ligase [Methanocellales archaeon]